MKKILFLFAVLFVTFKTNAQDLIITSDSQIIEAVIIEISDEAVKYKKFSNQSGPAFIIKPENILRIIYQNGEVQVFQSKPQKNQQKDDDCLEEIINLKTDVQEYIWVCNTLKTDFEFKLYGMAHKSGATELLCKDVVKKGELKRLETVYDKGRLDHFSSFKFCPIKEVKCNLHSGITEKKLYVTTEGTDNPVLTFDVFKSDAGKPMVRMNLSKEYQFTGDWVRVYDYSNFEEDLNDPNFKDENENVKIAAKPESFLGLLKEIKGDAVIEVTVGDGQKIYEIIKKETIDKLVSDFISAGGKVK